MDVEINPEIIQKAMLLHARIVEVPAHLNWDLQKTTGTKRRSSLRILSSILSCLISGFMFRPFMFFILPGLALIGLALYPITWAFIHTIYFYQHPPAHSNSLTHYGFSEAVAAAFNLSPHAFLVGGICLMVALQLISLGLIALQNKRYYEELFHLGTTIYKCNGNND
jgi:hypothetical protein